MKDARHVDVLTISDLRVTADLDLDPLGLSLLLLGLLDRLGNVTQLLLGTAEITKLNLVSICID